MQKIYHGVCIAAAALISLGLLLSLLGLALGGRPGDVAEYYDDNVNFHIPFVGSGRLGPLGWVRGWGNPLYGSNTVEHSYGGEGSGIRRLDFELSCADVVIREGDAFWVKAEKINARRFSTQVEGDSWEIKCDVKNVGGRIGLDRAPRITITVPKGFLSEELKLDSAMGTVEVKGLSARESSLKVGMGTVTVSDFSSGDCKIEIGMGTLELSGRITGSGTIDCGMGSADLTLEGKAADYGFSAKVGMGSITVGGKDLDGMGGMDLGGLGAERSWNTSAPNFFDVDCGMGSVAIDFSQKG